jgi:hypothetical protein
VHLPMGLFWGKTHFHRFSIWISPIPHRYSQDFIDFPWFPNDFPIFVCLSRIFGATTPSLPLARWTTRVNSKELSERGGAQWIGYMHCSKFSQLFKNMFTHTRYLCVSFCQFWICAFTCYIWVPWAAYVLYAKKWQRGWQATNNEGW